MLSFRYRLHPLQCLRGWSDRLCYAGCHAAGGRFRSAGGHVAKDCIFSHGFLGIYGMERKRKNIICPNKQEKSSQKAALLDSGIIIQLAEPHSKEGIFLKQRRLLMNLPVTCS